MIGLVRQGFHAWVDSITNADNDPSEPAAGTAEFLGAVFDEHGPIAADKVAAIWHARQFALAREAADLVAADIRATTRITLPNIDVRMQADLLIVSFNGNYQTPAMFSISAPEAICEVAENLRDHVMDEICTVWPVCPAHGRGLRAQPVENNAVWVCPEAEHTVAAVGKL
jgi:uncharacterized protein YoaH (UPF0181 family)